MSGYPPPTPNRQRDADRSHSLKFTGRMGKKKIYHPIHPENPCDSQLHGPLSSLPLSLLSLKV